MSQKISWTIGNAIWMKEFYYGNNVYVFLFRQSFFNSSYLYRNYLNFQVQIERMIAYLCAISGFQFLLLCN